jgi:hypothetical protein
MLQTFVAAAIAIVTFSVEIEGKSKPTIQIRGYICFVVQSSSSSDRAIYANINPVCADALCSGAESAPCFTWIGEMIKPPLFG